MIPKPIRATLVIACLALAACSQKRDAGVPTATSDDLQRWQTQAQKVAIVRDDWGIPHVRGKTDADAVFGLMYAQAEDDFNRVETNFLLSQGRLAEAEGEKELWRDLRMRLFIDPAEMKVQYDAAPAWLKALMNAWADGLNYYLHTHPQVKPRVLAHFEPWMALTFSEGSIGGDIERVALGDLEAFYTGKAPAVQRVAATGLTRFEPTGSNGFAIAPTNSASKHALLWINPHTSFFFRAEAQATSDEGLNVYGALTWGQFFVYQGFNEHAGWMHTSSGVDNIDEYLETVTQRAEGSYVYKYGQGERPLAAKQIAIRYKTPTGMANREFTVYRSHHGPIVRAIDGKWVSVRLMEEPLKALMQSYSRTKARNLAGFEAVMESHTNSSNNTVFADAEGNIAYFHSNFVPKRDAQLDWTKPVDGSLAATEWQGVHSFAESPHVVNPQAGWLYNTNNAPWSAAGEESPKQGDYPTYFDGAGENQRGVHAIRVLSRKKDFTPDTLIAAAFDRQMPALEPLLPKLFQAFNALPPNALRDRLAAPLAELRKWDLRWSADSVATTLGVLWGDELWDEIAKDAENRKISPYDHMAHITTAEQRLAALESVIDRLSADFGKWQVPWGEINRFQRITGDIVQPFDDAAPSIPVPFTTARWGSLATFGARNYQGSRKMYGTGGNSFLAVVEFGDKVSARAITAGGQSGDPRSPHFNDQATRYASGDLREVYFYPEQLEGHTERSYHPGE